MGSPIYWMKMWFSRIRPTTVIIFNRDIIADPAGFNLFTMVWLFSVNVNNNLKKTTPVIEFQVTRFSAKGLICIDLHPRLFQTINVNKTERVGFTNWFRDDTWNKGKEIQWKEGLEYVAFYLQIPVNANNNCNA